MDSAASFALSTSSFNFSSPLVSPFSYPFYPRSSSPISIPSPRSDDSFWSSPRPFNGVLKKPFKTDRKSSGVNAAAYAGCATEQKEEVAKPLVGNVRKMHCTMLGVSPQASPKEIRMAYRKLALHHPDVAPLHQLDTATKLFSEINEAYAILSDPQKRACYDLQLALEAPVSMSVVNSSSPRKYTDIGNWPCLSIHELLLQRMEGNTQSANRSMVVLGLLFQLPTKSAAQVWPQNFDSDITTPPWFKGPQLVESSDLMLTSF